MHARGAERTTTRGSDSGGSSVVAEVDISRAGDPAFGAPPGARQAMPAPPLPEFTYAAPEDVRADAYVDVPQYEDDDVTTDDADASTDDADDDDDHELRRLDQALFDAARGERDARAHEIGRGHDDDDAYSDGGGSAHRDHYARVGDDDVDETRFPAEDAAAAAAAASDVGAVEQSRAVPADKLAHIADADEERLVAHLAAPAPDDERAEAAGWAEAQAAAIPDHVDEVDHIQNTDDQDEEEEDDDDDGHLKHFVSARSHDPTASLDDHQLVADQQQPTVVDHTPAAAPPIPSPPQSIDRDTRHPQSVPPRSHSFTESPTQPADSAPSSTVAAAQYTVVAPRPESVAEPVTQSAPSAAASNKAAADTTSVAPPAPPTPPQSLDHADHRPPQSDPPRSHSIPDSATESFASATSSNPAAAAADLVAVAAAPTAASTPPPSLDHHDLLPPDALPPRSDSAAPTTPPHSLDIVSRQPHSTPPRSHSFSDSLAQVADSAAASTVASTVATAHPSIVAPTAPPTPPQSLDHAAHPRLESHPHRPESVADSATESFSSAPGSTTAAAAAAAADDDDDDDDAAAATAAPTPPQSVDHADRRPESVGHRSPSLGTRSESVASAAASSTAAAAPILDPRRVARSNLGLPASISGSDAGDRPTTSSRTRSLAGDGSEPATDYEVELLRRRLQQYSDALGELAHKANRKVRSAVSQRKEAIATAITIKDENTALVDQVRDLNARIAVLEAENSGHAKHADALAATVDTVSAELQHQRGEADRLQHLAHTAAAHSSASAAEARQRAAEDLTVQREERNVALRQRDAALEEAIVLKTQIAAADREIHLLTDHVTASETATRQLRDQLASAAGSIAEHRASAEREDMLAAFFTDFGKVVATHMPRMMASPTTPMYETKAAGSVSTGNGAASADI